MSNSDVKHSREPLNQSKGDLDQFSAMETLFQSETDSLVNRLDAFPKYASRQSIAKFLTKYEIFQKILHVNGSIVEGGVLHGGGTLGWAKLSSILEPTNHTRKIIGFDTFDGFPSVDEKDLVGNDGTLTKVGELKGSARGSVDEAVRVYDLNRPLSHIPKVELVQGDIAQTAPVYLEENPHLVVSLLYLDVDLYEPTKVLLETFLPRMPKGAIVVFDELNAKMFPGETVAVDEVLGLRDINIQRFPFDSYVSYAVLE
ncbi:TylF/MycF/NovP-related O-methyltransferase [Pseudophaeobacter sp. EL27]|uniref:TylF/MycF/NovP-related O-methyltransferase n=1 Tax=Pseudophaeobacter sp. EL27 TaxID=2107580 RepID=UPI000EFC772A|nr:TylF/MycF/NovP-related O-methyltransferase [Pseudophaeobacter sp. EL27]